MVSAIALATGLVSCSSKVSDTPFGKPIGKDGRAPATYTDFKNSPDYRITRDVWYHDERLASATPKNSVIRINLDNQRGTLWVDDRIAMDYPVSTGRSRFKTPKGSFAIQEKKEDYRSRTYGTVFNSAGKVVNGDATSSSPVPSGGKFVGTKMPLWMRIHGGYGLHIGVVYRDASSHGCIRVPKEPCRILFAKAGVGTKVVVE